VPYILATVDLDEGVRMIAQVRGIDLAEMKLGLPLEVGFERVTEGLTLPVFGRAGGRP
jgi:uncharacterized OB-fold protein